MTEQQEQTPEGMKMQGLLERIAQLTAEYENKIVDLRVAFTIASQERDEIRAALLELQASDESSA